jgi:hypothetical protein
MLGTSASHLVQDLAQHGFVGWEALLAGPVLAINIVLVRSAPLIGDAIGKRLARRIERGARGARRRAGRK